MKNVVLTGKFSSSRDDLITRLCNIGVKTLGSVGEAVDTVVVGNHFNIKLNRNAKIDKAKHLNIRLISETVFVMELKILEMKLMTESISPVVLAPMTDVFQKPEPIHVVFNGVFVCDVHLMKREWEASGNFTHDKVKGGTSLLVIGDREKFMTNHAAIIARGLNVPVMYEKEFIKQYQRPSFKVQLPGEIHNVEVKGVVSYDWNVGDTCWASNDAGYGISDDSFELIGDDVTLEIMSLYDSDGTPMSVVRRHPQGSHRCFRVDMLRPIKSKRDKVIDKAMLICNANGISHPNFKFLLGELYDEGLLKDVES